MPQDALRKYLDPSMLARLQGLELKARLIVEGYVSGWHKSPYHGFSVEFAEHREYVPGDDLRYVDWKVYGKSDRYYLKQFDEETNFACHLLVDTSESMGYRSDRAAWSKLAYAQHAAAALAYLVIRQQDAVGLATFDHGVGHLLRPASTPMHLSQLCTLLDQSSPAGESAIGPILHELAERFKRRGLVIILSDFFDDPEAVLLGLKHFRHRRHDVLLLQIIDPAEQDFPFDQPTLFHGLERWPDQMTDPRALRAAYQAEFDSFLRTLRGGARDLRMDYHLLRTDEPVETALSHLISHRMRRG
jgi:uncharacterized protein (DUF58 family)